MKKIYYLSFLGLLLSATIFAQKVDFEEYDLSNGMHVILHQDNSAPLVTTSVMYHVGAKGCRLFEMFFCPKLPKKENLPFRR